MGIRHTRMNLRTTQVNNSRIQVWSSNFAACSMIHAVKCLPHITAQGITSRNFFFAVIQPKFCHTLKVKDGIGQLGHTVPIVARVYMVVVVRALINIFWGGTRKRTGITGTVRGADSVHRHCTASVVKGHRHHSWAWTGPGSAVYLGDMPVELMVLCSARIMNLGQGRCGCTCTFTEVVTKPNTSSSEKETRQGVSGAYSKVGNSSRC